MTRQELELWDELVFRMCSEGFEANDSIDEAHKVIRARRLMLQLDPLEEGVVNE